MSLVYTYNGLRVMISIKAINCEQKCGEEGNTLFVLYCTHLTNKAKKHFKRKENRRKKFIYTNDTYNARQKVRKGKNKREAEGEKENRGKRSKKASMDCIASNIREGRVYLFLDKRVNISWGKLIIHVIT